MNAVKKALQIIQTKESPRRVRIVSDSQSVLLRVANLQPDIPLGSANESDILSLLAVLHHEGHQITFTWCPSHCGAVGIIWQTNKLEKELLPIKKMSDTSTRLRGPPTGVVSVGVKPPMGNSPNVAVVVLPQAPDDVPQKR